MKRPVLKLTACVMLVSMLASAMAGCKPLNIDPQQKETVPETTAAQSAAEPTEEPTQAPTEEPTEAPTEAPTETPTEEPTQEPTQAPTEPETTAAPQIQSGDPYYIRVNCETNTVNIFTQDDSGQYTVPYRVMVCSSGLDETPTPTGTYHLTGNRWNWLELVGGVWGQYTTQIIGNYLFHSVPYTEYGNHGSLQEGQYDLLGQDASHGCIRLSVDDAKWIYENMWDIEAVEIYNSPDPGPLGKPIPMRIGEREYPGWDPTDRVEGNPWHTGPSA